MNTQHRTSQVDPLPPETYLRMSLVLRAGLALALAVLVGGLIAFLVANPATSSSAVLAGNPILEFLTFHGFVSGLAAGTVGAYLTLGLILLVATPIVRVLTGLYYFRRAGERTMTAVTFTVLVLLLLGILVIGPLVR